jgi:hypothetical protein
VGRRRTASDIANCLTSVAVAIAWSSGDSDRTRDQTVNGLSKNARTTHPIIEAARVTTRPGVRSLDGSYRQPPPRHEDNVVLEREVGKWHGRGGQTRHGPPHIPVRDGS